ncbi:MAG: polysaccharide biosynthesis/export family protein [Candidatus Omnitrophica bacterium]|nr:polysaccharide biosynthesis/export family protein [Candidatus Omnitrophota bacterium]
MSVSRSTMRWAVMCGLIVGVCGCSRGRTELVVITGETYGSGVDALEVDALELSEPSGAVPAATFVPVGPAPEAAGQPAGLPPEDVEDYVKAAQRMLREGDFATASFLLEDAFKLDPDARSVRSLQAKLEKAQRAAQEQARRELINAYEREGRQILKQGDEDRALAYFYAAQALDPANRKIFNRIQQANATWQKRRAQQREVEFQKSLRIAKAAAEGTPEAESEPGKTIENEAAVLMSVSGTSAGTSQSAAEPQPSPEVSQLVAQPAPVAEAPVAQVEPDAPAEEAVADPAPPLAPATYGYTIQPEDVLRITVFEEPDLATLARVTAAGTITFPLLGHIDVAHLDVTQVQEKLTRLLGEDFLVNPQVHVFIESYHLQHVFVTGSVNKPGSYPIPTERPTTVMEAVALAGGFSEEAAVNKTKIIRIGEGKEQTIQVRVDDIIKRGDKTKDVVVYANDIVFVPESFF